MAIKILYNRKLYVFLTVWRSDKYPYCEFKLILYAIFASMIPPEEYEKMLEAQKASEDLEWKRLSSFFKKVFNCFKKKQSTN